nr:flocculation protein FLO11 [Parasteatoda tepidariorum]
MPNQLKNHNQTPTPNAANLFDLNSTYSSFPPQPQHLLPFSNQITPVEPIKIDHQGLLSDQHTTGEYSSSGIHPVTNVRLKNLILNRQNQKEQLQNFAAAAAAQNVGNIYSDTPVSPIPVHPQSGENDRYAQQTPPTPTSLHNRVGNNPSDNGIPAEDTSYLGQSLTYEPLRNLALPSPDSEMSWRKNDSPANLDEDSVLKNGQASINNSANHTDGISYSGTDQGSINGYGYQNFFDSSNSHDVNGSDSSNRDDFPASNNTSPQKYSTQNAQSVYTNQYFQSPNDMNSYSSNTNEVVVSQGSYPTTTSAQTNHSSPYSQHLSSSPDPREPLPSPYNQNQSYEHQTNGKSSETPTSKSESNSETTTSTMTDGTDRNSSNQSSEQGNFLLLTTASLNTYTNTINTYNTSTFPSSKNSTSLPAIGSIFNSGHTVISNSSDLATQLKVTYSGSVPTSHWISGGQLPPMVDNGRNDDFCGLDPVSLGGIFSSLIPAPSSNLILTTNDNSKNLVTSQQESNWWEQMKSTVKIEVPPASPDCEVLENQPSSPSTAALPTSL